MICRDELIIIIRNLVSDKGKNEFFLDEVVKLAKEKNINFPNSTIKTHISSKMCINSPQHHHTKYDDLERVKRGIYRLINL